MCNSSDHYEELKENIYSKELENLTLNSIQVLQLNLLFKEHGQIEL